jgi:hypothetical protein
MLYLIEVEAVFAFDLGERGVDRSREARNVELDRKVVAVLLRGLLPGGAELDAAGVNAELRALVGRVFDAGDAGLDVESEGADGAAEAVFGSGEGADGSHVQVPFVVSGHSSAASMAVDKTGSDWPAPEGRNAMAGGGFGISWRERRGLPQG